jgi:hypothetical protein
VFVKGIAPQGLKRTATTVKRIHLGEFRVIAAHVAPLDAVGGDTGITLLLFVPVYHLHHRIALQAINKIIIRGQGWQELAHSS